MAYLVDTDVLIDIAKGTDAAIGYVDSLLEPWSVSVITAMELLVGSRDKEEVARTDEFLEVIPVIPLGPVCRCQGIRLAEALCEVPRSPYFGCANRSHRHRSGQNVSQQKRKTLPYDFGTETRSAPILGLIRSPTLDGEKGIQPIPLELPA